MLIFGIKYLCSLFEDIKEEKPARLIISKDLWNMLLKELHYCNKVATQNGRPKTIIRQAIGYKLDIKVVNHPFTLKLETRKGTMPVKNIDRTAI